MKIRIILLVFVLLALSAACTNGVYDKALEPDCPNEIIVKDYDGPQHMILGIGMGGLAALDIGLDNPELFGASASLAGPVDLMGFLGEIEARLADFDDLPDPPGRAEILNQLRDLFIALGNPVYSNPASRFFPPGVTGSEPQTVTGLIDDLNPDGTTPAITFTDSSGVMVDFLLALDLNGNGVRDAGEPIILQFHEPFDDADGNGIHDEGESFSDVGLDGVAGTGDTGEGNGVFDEAPQIARWRAHDPLTRVTHGDLNLDSLFRGAVYADASVNDWWDYTAESDRLMDAIEAVQGHVNEPEPGFCLEFGVGRYDGFVTDFPYPTRRVFFPEKHMRLFWGPTAKAKDAHLGNESTQVARWSHALTFLSARLPNGYFGDSDFDTKPHYETHKFDAPSLGPDVRFPYAISLPAGYYDRKSRWKTYPLLLVLADRNQTPNDLIDLALAQDHLAHAGFGQQVVIVILDGSRDVVGGTGYHGFFDQAATEFPGDYRSVILSDLFDHLVDRYRIKVRTPNEQQGQH